MEIPRNTGELSRSFSAAKERAQEVIAETPGINQLIGGSAYEEKMMRRDRLNHYVGSIALVGSFTDYNTQINMPDGMIRELAEETVDGLVDSGFIEQDKIIGIRPLIPETAMDGRLHLTTTAVAIQESIEDLAQPPSVDLELEPAWVSSDRVINDEDFSKASHTALDSMVSDFQRKHSFEEKYGKEYEGIKNKLGIIAIVFANNFRAYGGLNYEDMKDGGIAILRRGGISKKEAFWGSLKKPYERVKSRDGGRFQRTSSKEPVHTSV